jgi:hypothetical protein
LFQKFPVLDEKKRLHDQLGYRLKICVNPLGMLRVPHRPLHLINQKQSCLIFLPERGKAAKIHERPEARRLARLHHHLVVLSREGGKHSRQARIAQTFVVRPLLRIAGIGVGPRFNPKYEIVSQP